MSSYVLDEIIGITKDRKSKNFWKKAILLLGEGIVAEELGELKYQMHKNTINNPAKYLTTLLKKQMIQKSSPIFLQQTLGKDKKMEKIETYFEETQLDLFKHLMPIKLPKSEEGKSGKMSIPYFGKNIPWPTFIGPEFFTLSTNKKKSDTVTAEFRFLDEPDIKTFLTRGKISSDSKKEFGIPTIQHWRVFAALELIWAEKGCNSVSFRDGTQVCQVTVSTKELAKTLGWKHWQHLGKNDLRWLKDIIAELKSMPYYLHLEDLNLKGIKGYGFYLIGDISLINKKARRGEETFFNIKFSSTVSYQLLKKHAVIRSKEMLYIHSEIACKIWMYLEPNLRSHNEACIDLKNLIEILQLPEANWHKDGFERKRQFAKAIKELNGQRLVDGRKMIVLIPKEKGLYDWQLVAHLEGVAIKQLEN